MAEKVNGCFVLLGNDVAQAARLIQSEDYRYTTSALSKIRGGDDPVVIFHHEIIDREVPNTPTVFVNHANGKYDEVSGNPKDVHIIGLLGICAWTKEEKKG
jgi:hypothetical protein